MRLPTSWRRLSIEERRIDESRISMERIAKQNEQPAPVGPVFAGFDHVVAGCDLGVEDLAKFRTEQVEMMWVDHS